MSIFLFDSLYLPFNRMALAALISSGRIPRRLRRRLCKCEYISKSHNVTVLLYHLVFPAKYRRAVFDDRVDKILKEVWVRSNLKCNTFLV
jgi:hypothetical protein